MTNEPSKVDFGIHPQDPRVRFAADRTLLAWVRTGLTIMTLGFAISRFNLSDQKNGFATPDSSADFSMWLGTGLVVLGALANLVAAYQFAGIFRRLRDGEHLPIRSWSPEIVLTIIIAALGILMAFGSSWWMPK
jgi:putative membrane protein